MQSFSTLGDGVAFLTADWTAIRHMIYLPWRRAISSAVAVPSAERMEKLRNLIIIAHIDSGKVRYLSILFVVNPATKSESSTHIKYSSILKSTLSDRLLQATGTVSVAQLASRSQFLDSNPIERERQITIKARAARMRWGDSRITLIDCPGHHDFSRQVSQSARAVEGALLIVDASKGVQAQTLSSVELALEAGLELVPVINKIDLPTADVPAARHQIEQLVGLDASDAVLTCAKTGFGVDALLNAIVHRLPAPEGSPDVRLQALVFDSYYDVYRGVVLFVRVVNGIISKGDRIRPMARSHSDDGSPSEFVVDKVGFLQPDEVEGNALQPGEIGFLTAAIKRTGDVPVGDTITHCGDKGADEQLPGYEDTKAVVFCGLFPSDSGDVTALRTALQKLQLQDASIVFEPDKSAAMGTGFRCGFLGLLHMSVTQQRLEEEFDLDLVASAPSVSYRVSVCILKIW